MKDNLKYTVLVVDDEPLVAELVGEVLSDHHMNVLIASSGLEALSLLEAHQVDAVVSDICMEGMDGFELLYEIAGVDDAINVILMTGYDSHEMVKRAIAAGAYDYLSKPLDDHSLIISATQRAAENTALVRQNTALITQLMRSNEQVIAANQRLTQLNTQLRKLANTDELTQLYNRRYIDEWLRTRLSNTDSQECYSIILMDIDFFKGVNDSYGHASGDKVLQQLAQILQTNHRETDLVGRYGGEEFIIVLPGCAADVAMTVAEKLRRLIETTPVCLGDHAVDVTASMGVATLAVLAKIESDASTAAPLSGRDLLAQADQALYLAKNQGRNRCVHHQHVETTPVDYRKAG